MVKGPGAEAAEELLDEEGVPGAGHTDQHKPNFVKHLNKTRTFSAKQKWEWAFDKILTVSGNFLVMFIYSEKATRISQSYFTSLSIPIWRFFFKFMWPSRKIWISYNRYLPSYIFLECQKYFTRHNVSYCFPMGFYTSAIYFLWMYYRDMKY